MTITTGSNGSSFALGCGLIVVDIGVVADDIIVGADVVIVDVERVDGIEFSVTAVVGLLFGRLGLLDGLRVVRLFPPAGRTFTVDDLVGLAVVALELGLRVGRL